MLRLRPRALSLVVGSVATAAGCSGEVRLVLPLPTVPSAQSAIVALIDDAGIEVFATAIDDPVTLSRPDQPLDARVELLLFERSLSELRLVGGPIAAASGDEGTRLPGAPFIYAAEIAAGRASPWVPKGTPGAELSAFRAADLAPAGCARLEIEPVTLPDTGVAFAVATDASARTIIFGENQRLWLLRDHDVERLDVVLPPDFRVAAGGTTHNGNVVLLDDDGRVVVGRFDGALLRTVLAFTGTRTAGRPRYVDGGLLADGPELFALSSGGEISQLTSALKRVDDRFEDLPGEGQYGGVVRLRSNVAVVGAASSTELWQTDRPAPLLTDVAGGVSALRGIEGFGVLVGTGAGEVRAEINGFDTLGPSGSVFPITGFAQFGDDGFLFGGAQGSLGYYTRARGYCFDETDHAPLIPVWIIEREDEWVVFGKKLVSQAARAAFVRVAR